MGAAWCLSAALGGLLACAIIAVNGDPRYRGNLKEDVGKSKEGRALMTTPEIELQIEQTRERLGETVEELAARADMKARARARASEMKARAAQVSGRVKDRTVDVSRRVRQHPAMQRRWPLAVAAGIVVAGSAVIWRRRRA